MSINKPRSIPIISYPKPSAVGIERGKPLIVITKGDPAGIGPEIISKAVYSSSLRNKAEYLIIGGKIQCRPGAPSANAGLAAFRNIKQAVDILRDTKGRKALVTGPINKYSLNKAGLKYTGHTEMLADLCRVKDVVMMFSADDFRVAIATRHIRLKDVPRSITKKGIISTAKIFHKALKEHFKINDPKIGIAGLNPHSGESGVLGSEEKLIIQPAVRSLRQRVSRNISGPHPADRVFFDLYNKKYDGVIGMYHDQALGPFKMLFFDKGVNVTLGLPFIRTSPDHGTAFDIAGKGIADPTSMIEAVKLAIRLA